MTERLGGRVQWFCNTSGEGMISAENGRTYYVSWGSVRGKFPPKHGKPSWVELEPGYGVEFELCCGQAHNVDVLDPTKAKPPGSMYRDRDQMKMKLTAARAMFSEDFPKCPINYDELHRLRNKPKALTQKETNKVERLEAQLNEHYERVQAHNSALSALECSIYREHANFDLLNPMKPEDEFERFIEG